MTRLKKNVLCCISCCTILFRWSSSCLTSQQLISFAIIQGLSSSLLNRSVPSSALRALVALRTVTCLSDADFCFPTAKSVPLCLATPLVQRVPSFSAVAASSKLFDNIFLTAWHSQVLFSTPRVPKPADNLSRDLFPAIRIFQCLSCIAGSFHSHCLKL